MGASLGASYAFMSSARGSRILQEEELARISEMARLSEMDAGEGAGNHHMASLLTTERNVRSPSLVKDKRSEYLNKIKNEFIQGNHFAHPSTPPPILPSSSPPDNSSHSDEMWTGKRVHRQSFMLSQSSDGVLSDDRQRDKDKDKDKDKDEKARLKREEKEKLKEEKLKKKQEKKEMKMRAKAVTEPPNIANGENNKLLHALGIIFCHFCYHSVF